MIFIKEVLVLFLFLLSPSSALRCFECAQASQHRCANLINIQQNVCAVPPNNTEEAQDAGVKNVCIKTLLPYLDPNKTDIHIGRSCGRAGPGREDSCKEMTKAYLIRNRNVTCLSCDTDLCNRSETILTSVVVTLTIALSMLWFSFA